MQARTARVLAWAGAVLCVVMVAGVYAIAAGAGRSLDPRDIGVLWALLVLTFPLAGALIATRRPESPIGWLFVGIGLSFCLAALAQEWATYAVITAPGALPLGGVMSWVGAWAWSPGILLLFTFLPLLFPDGRLPSRRWRPVAWLSLAVLVVIVLPVAVTAWPLRGPVLATLGDSPPADAPTAFKVGYNTQIAGILVMFVLGPICAASLILRMRRATGDERQQIKWFAFAVLILVVAVILASPLFSVAEELLVLAVPLIPIASGVAILKYRLYDVDLVISKTVMVGALAALVTVVYLAVVVGVGTLVGTRGEPNVVLSIVATAIVAVAFQPLRERARRLANRLVYGKRATPYEVLSVFSERMRETLATQEMLPRLVRALADSTGATRAEVWLRSGDGLRRAASWPPRDEEDPWAPLGGSDAIPSLPGADRVAEVRHQGELLGALTLAKPASDPVTSTEDKLLSDLASQAGLVLRNARLSADLQARLDELRSSRQRLVVAQDEERRKLERNLHDGAQQELVALAVKAGVASALTAKDPGRAAQLLTELREGLADALETLRDLARGIYPPLLADQGLAMALEGQARKAAIPVTVEADGIGRYGQEVEAAVYFCVLEALNNVAKYAAASSAAVRLSESGGELQFRIADDGRGFDPAATGYGTGLQGMADRLDAIGGTLQIQSRPGHGTTVTGRLAVRRI
ncbi:MAG TPA: histidine kinase [Egibacteraceae bacterium]|nr:histidine kinase [Egibacteraceae bacterium]